MIMKQGFILRQSQSHRIALQTQQAIKLLPLPVIELQAFVDAEIECNPLLERDEHCNAHQNFEFPVQSSSEIGIVSAASERSAEPRDRVISDFDQVNLNSNEPYTEEAGRVHLRA